MVTSSQYFDKEIPVNQQQQQSSGGHVEGRRRPFQKLERISTAGPLGAASPKPGHYVVGHPELEGDEVTFRYFEGSNTLIPLSYKENGIEVYAREKGSELGRTKFSIPLVLILDPTRKIPKLEKHFAEFQEDYERMIDLIRVQFAYSFVAQVHRLNSPVQFSRRH